jgi:hypothetical protein
MLEVNRSGRVVEYKRGHYYLTHVEWEDGHCEIEVHHCKPDLVFHSCDEKQLQKAKDILLKVSENESSLCLPLLARSAVSLSLSEQDIEGRELQE